MSTAALQATAFLLSRRSMARLAGALYVVAVATAVFAEFILPGRLAVAASIAIPVACYAGVTLLLYAILRSVSSRLALVAALSGFTGLAFEAFRWHPQGINLGMTCHALFCLITAVLFFRSGDVPRVAATLMACAGLIWMLYLIPALANAVTPWNSFAGLVCEAIPMLWLLAAGVPDRSSQTPSSLTEVAP